MEKRNDMDITEMEALMDEFSCGKEDFFRETPEEEAINDEHVKGLLKKFNIIR